MKTISVFVSAPIAGFDNDIEYAEFREKLLCLVQKIRDCEVVTELYSALSSVSSQSEYDSPQKAAIQDLGALNKATHFILFYPKRVPSSALIELGFALAQNKKILIIVNRISDLPYMAQGFCASPFSIPILQKTIDEISLSDLQQFFCSNNCG